MNMICDLWAMDHSGKYNFMYDICLSETVDMFPSSSSSSSSSLFLRDCQPEREAKILHYRSTFKYLLTIHVVKKTLIMCEQVYHGLNAWP